MRVSGLGLGSREVSGCTCCESPTFTAFLFFFFTTIFRTSPPSDSNGGGPDGGGPAGGEAPEEGSFFFFLTCQRAGNGAERGSTSLTLLTAGSGEHAPFSGVPQVEVQPAAVVVLRQLLTQPRALMGVTLLA